MDGEVKAMEISNATLATPTGSEIINERREKRPLSASSATDETEEKKKRVEGEDENIAITGEMVHGTQASDLNSVVTTESDQKGNQACGFSSDTASLDIKTTSHTNHENLDNIFETEEVSAEATRTLMYKLFKMSDPAQFQIEGVKTDKSNPQSYDSKLTQSLTLECVLNENNRFLRSISSTLDNVNSILKCNIDETTSLSERVDQIETLVDSSLTKLDNKVRRCDQSNSDLTKLVGKSYEHVDEKFSNLKEAIPETIAEMSLEFDTKLKIHKTDVVLAISGEVAKIPSASQLQKKIQANFDT